MTPSGKARSGILVRDVSLPSRKERQFALHVIGSLNPRLSLGLVAIRCQREPGGIVPLTLSIPDTVEVPACGE